MADIQAKQTAKLEMLADVDGTLEDVLSGTIGTTEVEWLGSCAEEINPVFEPQSNERNNICKGRVVSITDTYLNVSVDSSAVDSDGIQNAMELEIFRNRANQAINQKPRIFRLTDSLLDRLDTPDGEQVIYFEGVITTNEWTIVAGEMRGYSIEIQAFGSYVENPVIVTP